jgi:hypothetical protein
VKYSACSGAVRWSGGLTVLKPGQSIKDDHPLVIERPDLFTDDEPEADIPLPAGPRGRHVPQVERATQAPGEARVIAPKTVAKKTAAPKKDAAGE